MAYFIGFSAGMALCLLLHWLMPRSVLPNDVEQLKALLHAAHGKVDALTAKLRSREVLIEQLKLQLARLKRMKFGRSSEQLDAQIAQLELSLEELEANAQAALPPDEEAAAPVIKPTRKPLPEHLPREAHVHEPVSGVCNCPQCGGTAYFTPSRSLVSRHAGQRFHVMSVGHFT